MQKDDSATKDQDKLSSSNGKKESSGDGLVMVLGALTGFLIVWLLLHFHILDGILF